MPTIAQLKTTLTALEAVTSTQVGNDTEDGLWRKIALALEERRGASSSANDTMLGWMTRAAVAAEAQWGGSGAEESGSYAGLLKRIVDAMELDAGVTDGSLAGRLVVAAGLVLTAPTITSANPSATVTQGAVVTWTLTGDEAATFTAIGPNADLVTIIPVDATSATASLDTSTPGIVSFTIRATDAGGNIGTQAIAFTIQAAPNWIVTQDATGAGGALETVASKSVTVTTTLASNRIGLAFTSLINGGAETITSATWGGVPMTLVAGNTVATDGTRMQLVACYRLDNPPVGSATVTVNRTGATSSRWNLQVVVVSDANLTFIDSDHYTSQTDASSFTPTASTVTGTEQTALLFAAGEQISQSNVANFTATDWTSVYRHQAANSPALSTLFRRDFTAAGTASATVVHSTGTSLRGMAAIMLVLESVDAVAVVPTYYVANSGNDANDGLSLATAFKSLDPIDALTFDAGTTIILEDGQHHRRATRPTYGTPILSANSLGTSLNPCVLKTRSGGQAWISGSEVKSAGWSASTALETNSTAFAAGAQKITLGSFLTYRQCAFPTIDGNMLVPCSWNAQGFPTCPHDWEYYMEGTDSFTFLPDARVQEGSGSPIASFDMTKISAGVGVVCTSVFASGSDYTWTVRVYDPAIAAHYGANSPVGAALYFVSDNTQMQMRRITAYSQASSYVEAVYLDISNAGPRVPGFFWAILFHPLDLVQEGQFARIGNDLHAIFPTGTVRAISAGDKGVLLEGGAWEIGPGVGFCDFSNDQAESSAFDNFLIARGGPWAHTGTMSFKNGLNPGRPGLLAALDDGPGQRWHDAALDRIDTEAVTTFSVFRLTEATDLLVDYVRAVEVGRGGVYAAGSAYNIVINNLETPYSAPIHGQPLAVYQGAHSVTVGRMLTVGVVAAFTLQSDSATARPPGKNVEVTNFFMTQARAVSTSAAGSPFSTQLVRVDSDFTDCLLSKGVADAKGYVAVSIGDAVGMPAVNSNLAQIASSRTSSMPGGVTSRSVGDGFTGDGAAYPLSDTQWKRLTDTGSGSGPYETVVIGTLDYGWTVPAWHTSFAMIDLIPFYAPLRGPWQAGKAMMTLLGISPLSTISFPAGITNNDLFFIDGAEVVPLAQPTKGAYSITVRETNVSAYAVNGPTRDTVIAFTII